MLFSDDAADAGPQVPILGDQVEHGLAALHQLADKLSVAPGEEPDGPVLPLAEGGHRVKVAPVLAAQAEHADPLVLQRLPELGLDLRTVEFGHGATPRNGELTACRADQFLARLAGGDETIQRASPRGQLQDGPERGRKQEGDEPAEMP